MCVYYLSDTKKGDEDMSDYEYLFSRFAEPSVILLYDGTSIRTENINDKYLNEIGMNIDSREYTDTPVEDSFKSSEYEVYFEAVKRCALTGTETTAQTWRKFTHDCCGDNTVCIKSRFILLDKTENTYRICESIRNVTEERRNLDDLVEGDRRVKIAIEQINIYYWEYTVATKEMRPCYRCMRDLGLPALVRNYPEPAIEAGIFPLDYADMYRDWHRQIAEGAKELEAVIPLTIARVPFRVRYTTEFDENGKPYKAYGSATLVSDEELRQKDELNMTHEQLVTAMNEAKRANQAKSEFLARMSHEIRTPMNAIMGMNEIIYKNATDETIKTYAHDAYNAATSLLGIINEILDFSKIESGKLDLVNDNYNSAAFLASLYSMFAMRAEDKNLALVFNVDPDIPKTLFGDEIHIRQVLTNLLSNAVKYTDAGTITFGAKCLGISDNIATIHFEVTDTGRGIKKEDMNHLFEAFYRLEEKNSKNIEGTGLGMSIVAHLLKMMDSEIKVQSEYGKGSTFSFDLKQPVVSSEPMGDYKAGLDESESGSEKPLYTNPKAAVLVVDDNAVNLRVITALLKETGMHIVPVTSGPMALRAAAQHKFDLIFLDHFMPGMDGIETRERLVQENNLNHETPVIALTANAIKGAEEEYRAHGFTDVVYKPTTQEALNAILWKYLG